MGTDFGNELERLRRQLKQVSAERDWLRKENARLRDRTRTRDLGPSEAEEPNKSATSTLTVSNAERVPSIVGHGADQISNAQVGLLRSLFRGREDVYARLWQSARSGKTGYSPACNNEWDPSLCDKRKVRCGDCPNREFAPVTDGSIRGHLQGKHTMGMYPLFPDGTCQVLAADFDKQSWHEDAAAFIETCRRIGIPAALERSRSGNGAHAWIFFSEPVKAASARKLGCHLLTETMTYRHELGMDSYDRLFPNQDTMPKGGFGNLIALPLQKGPSEKGNSLFTDAEFHPHKDQWAFLSSIIRVTPSSLEETVREAARGARVMGVRAIPTDAADLPWNPAPVQRSMAILPGGSLISKMSVVLGNLIYVQTEGMPSSFLTRIKQLASFQNPEFYKRQSLRLSTALTPRVICCAEEQPGYLAIPRGCLEELQNLAQGAGIELDAADKRFEGTQIKVTFQGRLTSEQAEASAELLQHDNGVLVAPPGSGKTVVGTHVIAARGVNTLVLVHRRPLMEQWRAQLANLLGLDPAAIGQVGGGKGRRSGVIDVAMLQSLTRMGEVEDLVAEYGHVVVDECHHLPAVSFERVLRQVRARFVTGLTATPYRRDGHQPIILMQCGPIRHTGGHGHGDFAKRVICRHTEFATASKDGEPSIHDVYEALLTDDARNQMITSDVLRVLGEGRSPILLTERREHLEFFAARLAMFVPNVVVLHGSMGVRQRRAVAEQMSAIPEDQPRVLLATGRYIGEGFDDARLDTLFLAMPVSWKGTLVQYTGRLQRVHHGKTELRVYDYVDQGVPVLERMFRKRLRGYKALGYETDSPDDK